MGGRSIARKMRLNRHSLDEDSAARMLGGAVHPDDAPPGYGSVVGLLATAAARPPLGEDAGGATIAAMVEAIRDATPVATPKRRPVLAKLLAGKAIAAVAVLGLSATGAAAATGTLPDPVQGVVSDAVSHVGVEIPHPNHGKSAAHRQDGKHRKDGDHRKDGTTPSTSDQPAEDGPDKADNHGQQTSGAAHDAKTVAKEAGEKVGPAVCTAVGSHCQAGKDKPSEDETTPGTTGSADDGEAPGKSGDDHGAKNEHATTPTTGGIATGELNSGRELPSSDKGKGGRPE
jgi:hypothetical protein